MPTRAEPSAQFGDARRAVPRGASAARWAICAAILSAAGAGCSGDGAGRARDDAAVRVDAARAEGGAEVLSLVADDPRSVARALLAWAEGAPPAVIDPAQRRVLDACGVRVLLVPEAEVGAAMSAALEGTRGTSRSTQALTPSPAWVELAREPGDAEPRVVALHDSRVRLRPGFVRMLARCWIEPALVGDESGARFASVLRVEIAFQHVEYGAGGAAGGGLDPWSRSIARPGSTEARPRSIEQQGQVFSRLTTSVALAPGRALVIVHERPGVEWRSMLAQPDSPPDEPDEPVASPRLGEVRRDEPGTARAGGRGAGRAGPDVPALFRTPTLGEVLLAGAPIAGEGGGGGGATGGPRVVLVVTPRLREEFSILGR